jgi:hypothetical protein
VLTRQTIATGLGIGSLLLIGFSAAVSNGLLAAAIPTELIGLSGQKNGCDANLESVSQMSLAEIHTPDRTLIHDANAGAYCNEASPRHNTL